MTAHSLSIGRLSALTGVKVTTIRYYESVGLLPAPPRSESNRRLYGPDHVETLAFIRRSRAFGLALEAIRDLLALERDVAGTCAPVAHIAKTALADIEHRIADLSVLRDQLRAFVDHCTGTRIDHCSILRALHGVGAPGDGRMRRIDVERL